MKKLNEMRIEKRLTSSFCITTLITSVAAIAAILVLLIISSRYKFLSGWKQSAWTEILLYTFLKGEWI